MQVRTMLVALISTVAVGFVGVVSPVQAVGVGEEGCTPGYWKNHQDNWQEAAPSDLLSSAYSSVAGTSVAGLTMAEALAQPGGSGVAGAERILARAATAAWLNAAHDDLGYPWRRNATGVDGRPPLRRTVNDAYASGSRSTMLALASRLDRDNNLGCPLN